MSNYVEMNASCKLDLLSITRGQRDILLKLTDQMTLERQSMDAIIARIIEITMNADDHPDIIKIRGLLENLQDD